MGAVGVHCDGPQVVGQGVLAKRGELDHQVDPVDQRGADPLSQAREHVFVKVRGAADGRPLILQEELQTR